VAAAETKRDADCCCDISQSPHPADANISCSSSSSSSNLHPVHRCKRACSTRMLCALTPLASPTKMRCLCCHSNRDGLGSNSVVARQQARSTDADATAAAASAILSSYDTHVCTRVLASFHLRVSYQDGDRRLASSSQLCPHRQQQQQQLTNITRATTNKQSKQARYQQRDVNSILQVTSNWTFRCPFA
jgi:hypothetical protein